jgi:hypothetical protein
VLALGVGHSQVVGTAGIFGHDANGTAGQPAGGS